MVQAPEKHRAVVEIVQRILAGKKGVRHQRAAARWDPFGKLWRSELAAWMLRGVIREGSLISHCGTEVPRQNQ